MRFSTKEYEEIGLFIQNFLKREVYSSIPAVTNHLNSEIEKGNLRLKCRDRLITKLKPQTIRSVCQAEETIELKKAAGVWLAASVIVSQLKTGHVVVYSSNEMRRIVEFLEKQLKLLPRT